MVLTQTKIPTEAITWDFSYSRSKGKFRFRNEDGEWLCNRIAGGAFIRGCDNQRGNIAMHAKMAMGDDGLAMLYRDPGQEKDFDHYVDDITEICSLRQPTSGGTAFPETHNELEDHVQSGFLPAQLFDYDEMPKNPTHWRLCFHRAGENWRVRNERTGRLWLVEGYYGPVNVNWLDGGTHIFAEDIISVDAETSIAVIGG